MIKETTRKILINRVTDAIMLKITIALPFLGVPVIRQITSYFVSKVVVHVFVFAEEWGIVIGTEYKVEGQQKKYDDAVIIFEDIIDKPDISDEEKQKAENEFDKTLRDLIRLDVS